MLVLKDICVLNLSKEPVHFLPPVDPFNPLLLPCFHRLQVPKKYILLIRTLFLSFVEHNDNSQHV